MRRRLTTTSDRPEQIRCRYFSFLRVAVRSRVILAFASIFIVWGSTYLAIRYAVDEIPPLLTAAVRHVVAGAILLAWARSKGLRATSGGVAAQRGRWRALLSHWSRHPSLGGRQRAVGTLGVARGDRAGLDCRLAGAHGGRAAASANHRWPVSRLVVCGCSWGTTRYSPATRCC